MAVLSNFENIDPDLNYQLYSENDESCNYYTLKEYNGGLSTVDFFSILHYNLRSFNKNFVHFSSAFLSSSKSPDIFSITETWFSGDQTASVSGYQGFHITRDGRSGGVSTYVKEQYDAACVDELSYANSTIEVCTVDVKVGNFSCTVIAIYRPHSDTIPNFCDHLSVFLNHPHFRNKLCVLLGDLNICLLKNEVSNNEYSNILYAHHFVPLINKPSRYSKIEGVSPTLLDHIFINKIHTNICGLVDFDITDHLPTFVHLKLNNSITQNKRKLQFRLVNDENKRNFQNLLTNFDWDSIRGDADSYAENFQNVLNDLYCKAFPMKTKLVSEKHFENHWVTPEIIRLLDAKSEYFTLYRMNLISSEENNRYKNKVTNIVRKHKIKYYSELFIRHKNNLHKTWNLINTLLSKGIKTTTINKIMHNNLIYTREYDIANIFNDYFCSIGDILDSNIPISYSDPLQNVKINNNSSFFLYPTSPVEVKNILDALKNSKQHINCVSDAILKENSEFLSVIISDIANICFETGSFPKCLKKALVLPLFKKGDRSIISNYRPISKLPPLSKIIEKCIKFRLISFLTNADILSPYQFGFQRGLSTQDAIVYLNEKIYEALNSQFSSIGIFIDYSKAFDTINRYILINKLRYYGICGVALSLISSYLSDRWQSVKVGDSFSSLKQCNLGVPQGSVLGPILFLIYVNEIPNISNSFSSCLFADDTSLIFSSNNHVSLVNSCNLGLEKFYEWSCANRLSINNDKTNLMLFTNSKESINLSNIQLNNSMIEHVSSVRFLGVEMDENLKFNLHINNIAKKISQNTGILRKLKEFVPADTLLHLYYIFIESYMNYCTLSFGNAFDTHLRPLEVAQKKCVRVVGNQPYFSHTNPIFRRLKILKFKDIYRYNLGIYMYKNLDHFTNRRSLHDHDTRSGNSYDSVFQRLTLTQRQSLEFQAPNNWNSIPIYIRVSPSINIFKNRYKEYLISLYN